MRTRNGTVHPSGRLVRWLTPGLLSLALVALAIAGLATASVALAATGPVVTHVSAATGPATGGNTVTITGKNFMSGGKSAVKKVLFGTKAASHLRVKSATKLTVTAPSHAAGTVQVRVVSTSGAMSAKAKAARYTYKLPLPTITALSPTSGTSTGGTSVVITGTHLAGATSVTFGGLPATVTADSATQITATSPAYPDATVNTTIFVLVQTAAGWTDPTMFDQYTFTVAAPPTGAPTVTAVTPTSGLAGDTITITGTNFTAATAVVFDTTAATSFTVASDTSITATVPAGVGTVDVMVTNTSGTSAMSTADWFTYNS